MARKNSKPEFAVIGLGRFGTSLALRLVEQGYTVLGIDRDRSLVQRLADELTQVVALDSTDEDALRAIDIASFDTVIVAIGADFEANLLTTVALKNLHVPRIICKASSIRHQTILQAVGADQVVLPEYESAHRLASSLTMPMLVDRIAMGDAYNIAEIAVPRSWLGRTLRDLQPRERFGVTVIAIHHGNQLIVSPPADYRFTQDDKLAVVGTNEQTAQMAALT